MTSTGPQEGWAFGDSNTVLRWNGTAFTKEPNARKFNASSGLGV